MARFVFLISLVSFVFFSAQDARAGEGGISEGGGKAIVCESPNRYAVSLDLFEAEQIRGVEFDESLLAADEWETARNIIARIAKFDVFRATKYTKYLDAFLQESRWIHVPLENIDDSFQVFLPGPSCEIQQAAIQRKPQFPEDPRYLIDQKIWDIMSTRDRAALLLHEVIYRETRGWGEANSTTARYYNSMLASTKAATFKVNDYQKVRTASRLPFEFSVKVDNRDFFFIASSGNTGIVGNGSQSPLYVCNRYGMSLVVFSNENEDQELLEKVHSAASALIGTEAPLAAVYQLPRYYGGGSHNGQTYYGFLRFNWQAIDSSYSHALCSKR